MRKVEKFLKRRSGLEDTTNGNISSWYVVDPEGSSNKMGEGYTCDSLNNSSYVGWDIPDYHKRVKRGELMPHTPWQQQSLTGSCSGGSDYSYYDTDKPDDIWRVYRDGNYCPLDDWIITGEEGSAYVPERYDEYVQEAAAKIYSSGHDTLTFLAEILDVRHLVVGTLKKILTLKIPRNWRSLANDWLSTRYGWRTLIYDVQDIYKALSHLDEVRTRYSDRSGTTYSTTKQDTYVHSQWLLDLDCQKIDKITTSIRGSVAADIEVPKFQFNPITTAWELIPFSFVVDWLVSVGKSLAAMSFLALQHTYVASCGYRITIERSFHAEIGGTHAEGRVVYAGGEHWQTGSSKLVIEKRTPCAVPNLPHFKLRLDALKIIDLVGLVTQRVRR
jgi:hypothetical protein